MNSCLKRFFLALVFILLPTSRSWSQPNLSGYFNDNSFSLLDLSDYQDIEFTWTLRGALQVNMNEGINELREGNRERAILNLNEVLKSDSIFWPAYYYRGICKKNLGDLEGAEFDLVKAIKLNGKIPEPFIELGEIYNAKKQFSKAKSIYQTAQELSPNSVQPIYLIGTLALSQGEKGKALKAYEKCNELDPSIAPAYITRAILKYRDDQKDISKSILLFNKAITADSTFRPAYFWRGMFFIKNGNPEKGLSDWNKLIQLMPDNILALQLRGYLFIELGRFDEAFSDIRRSIQLSSNRGLFATEETVLNKSTDLRNAISYLSRKGYGLKEETFSILKKSYCLLVIGKNKEALESLLVASSMELCGSTFLLKGIAYEQLNLPDSALFNYNKALAIDNDIYDAHRKRATYRYQKKDIKGAHADLMEMKRIEPESNSTYRQSGIFKSALKDYWGCIVDLSRFIKNDSSDAEVWITRALCRSEVKDYKGSNEDCKHAISLRPKNNKSYKIMMLNHLMDKDTLAALQMMKRIYASWPGEYEIGLGMSELYIRYKKYDSAAYAVNNIIALSEVGINAEYLPTALFFKSQILVAESKLEDGLQFLTKSIKLNPVINRIFIRAKLLLKMGKTKDALKDLRQLRDLKYAPGNEYYTKYLGN